MGATEMIAVDRTLCTRCGACQGVCPNDVFRFADNRLVIPHSGRCIHCGHCVAVCGAGAISHRGITGAFEQLGAPPVTEEALQSLFARRRSCRSFGETKVAPDELTALLDAAARAPTGTNSQNVRFIALDTPPEIDALAVATAGYYLRLARRMENPLVRAVLRVTVGRRIVDAYRFHLPAIAERFERRRADGGALFYGAPLVLIGVAPGLPHMALANVNLAVMQMMLKAEAMGLGTLYNGYALTALTRDRALRRRMGLAKGISPGAVLAVGRPETVFLRAPPRRRPRLSRP